MKSTLKKSITVMALTASGWAVLAQNADIYFRNFNWHASDPVNAPFFNNQEERLGQNYQAQLYLWVEGKGFLAVGSPTPFFSKEDQKGYFSRGAVNLDSFIEGGDSGWVQVRAWKSDGGDTFEEAALAGAWTGVSNKLYMNVIGGFSHIPTLPTLMVGLKYPGAPIIVKQPESQTIQARAKVTLSVVASSGVKATYQWYQDTSDTPDGRIWGANAPTYSPPNLKQDTAFWVTVSNSAGSVTSEAAEVTVLDGHRPWLGVRIHREARQVQLIIDGKSGAKYDIQFTGNLVEPIQWQPLTQVTTAMKVDWFYLKYDPEQPTRFYRAIELP